MGELRKIVSKDSHQTVYDYVGRVGELFYDTEMRQIRISDGGTPGGLSIGGGSSFQNSEIQEGHSQGNNYVSSITGHLHTGISLTSDTWSQLMWVANTSIITVDGISNGPQNQDYGWVYVDGAGIFIQNVTQQYDHQEWTFRPDGRLQMPESTTMTSGSIEFNEKGRAEFGTEIYRPSTAIVDSQVYMGSGYGEFRSIYNHYGPEVSLTYAGVEDTQNGYYSGIISQTPLMIGEYNVKTNVHDNIIIGAAQYYGALESIEWSTAAGTINYRGTINGIYAGQNLTNITGGSVGSSKVVLSDNGLKLVTQFDNYQGPSPSPFWWSAYGGLDNGSPEVMTGASLAYGSDDSLYVIGSHGNLSTYLGDSLALKYDQGGDIVWRKDWTDTAGDPCGSWNNTFDIDVNDNDRIYWTSRAFNYPFPTAINYLGRMDRDGNITETPLRCEDILITDVQVANDQTGNIWIVGSQIVDTQLQPMIAKVNVLDKTVYWHGNTCVQGSVAGQTNVWSSISVDPDSMHRVVMGTYTKNDGHYRPMIKTFSVNGTPGDTYDVADGLDNSHDYDGIAAYFFNGNVYAAFVDTSAGCSYVTKYNHYDISTKLWQVKIGDNNQTYVYDLAFSGTDLFVGGTSIGYNPPTSDSDFFLWSLNSVDGSVNWSYSIGTEADDQMPEGYDAKPVCRGLAVSHSGDYVAMTGMIQQGPVSAASTFQLPTDGSINGSNFGFFVDSYNLGYAAGNFANSVVVTDHFSSATPITLANAALIATTNTYSTVDYEYHVDLLYGSEIAPPLRRNEWQFDINGVIHLPQDGDIVDSNGISVIHDSLFAYDNDTHKANVIDLSKDIHILINTDNAYAIPDGRYNGQTLKFIADSAGGITDVTAVQITGNFAVNTSNSIQTSNINWNPFNNGFYNSAIWYNGAWHAISL